MTQRYIPLAGSPIGERGFVDSPNGLEAKFDNVWGVCNNAFDDKLYVCDWGNQAIRSVELSSGQYGVETVLDMSTASTDRLSAPLTDVHPRYIDWDPIANRLWFTATDDTYANATIYSYRTDTMELRNWVSTVSGNPPGHLAPGTSAHGGVVYRRHFDNRILSAGEELDPDHLPAYRYFSDREFEAFPDATEGVHWVYHRDGSFPSSDTPIMWAADEPGVILLGETNYVYPSGYGYYITGTSGHGDWLHPYLKSDDDFSPDAPTSTNRDSYTVPYPNGIRGWSMKHGPIVDSGTHSYKAVQPLRNKPEGALQLIPYQDYGGSYDGWGIDYQHFTQIGPAYMPCVDVAYSVDHDQYYVTMGQFNFTPTEGMYSGAPYNTLGTFGERSGEWHTRLI